MIDPKSLSNWTPYALAVLRIVAGLIFLEHGTQKLLGFPSGERAFVDAMTLSWWAGVFELILGALITLGLFTRGAAFIAAGEMAFAYWIAHAPQNFFLSITVVTRPFFIVSCSCSLFSRVLADGASTLGAKQKTSAHLLSLNGNDIPHPKKPRPQRRKVRVDRLFEEALCPLWVISRQYQG
jgi:putative oxidoreductase